MNTTLKYVLLPIIFATCSALPSFSQGASEEVRKKVNVVIAKAYEEASAQFPCKLKASGKAKMGNWKDVENCVNPAHDLVNWKNHALELQKIRDTERYQREDMIAVIEAALSEQALPYEKVFLVKSKNVALLPLSNSLLKFLPENSLAGLPVYSTDGEHLGSFSGVYPYERIGGLEVISSYRMMNFQYTDLHGENKTPAEKFLLDLYGVPWEDAKSQSGFRLPSDRLIPSR